MMSPRRCLALLCLALLAACGGGVGTGGTGSYGAAPVAGYGSIFVGGIEFDTAHASVQDDDGAPLAGEPPLGAMVEVEGGAVVDAAAGPSAGASVVRLARSIVGPVASNDVGARSFSVLGQAVQVNGSTVFDAGLHGGLAALKPGDIVSVHALADAQGRPVATRVEPALPGEPWRLRGYVAGLDAAAKRFRIGAATLDYANAAPLPAGLAQGQLVSVRLATPGADNGLLAVAAFGPASAAPVRAERVEVEGLVAAPDATGFRIGGLRIEASAASIEPPGAAPAAGAQVEVEGRLEGGMLRASRLRVPTAQEIEHRNYQLAGSIDAVDVAASSFVLRGIGVDFGAAQLVGGDLGSIVAGARVHAQGRLSADGTRLEATRIELR